MTEACGKNDCSPENNLTKETIYNDKFWTEIHTLLGQVVVRNGAEVIHDPFTKFLMLMRKLMLQIIAWHPTKIERRDDMGREADMLHHKIGLSKKRFGVVLHYFFEHFTSASSIMDPQCESPVKEGNTCISRMPQWSVAVPAAPAGSVQSDSAKY